MKKNILTILFITFILFVSCQNQMYHSVLEVSVVDSKTSEVVNGNVYDFSIDNADENKGKFLRIMNKTYDASGLQMNTLSNFDVSSNGDSELRTTTDSNGAMTIRLSDIKTPSIYTIVAHSSVQSIFPQSFIINATSELSNIKASYELTNGKGDMTLEEKYKSGTINFTSNSLYAEKDIDLIKGGEYLLKISSAKEGVNLNEVEVYSDNENVVVVQDVQNTECKIKVIGSNNTTTFIGIKPIGSDIVKKVQITSIDLTEIEIKEESENKKSEEMLCLNVNDTLTRKVEYIGLVEEDLRFSINAENIEQDRYYLDEEKVYIPEMNENAKWVKKYTLVQKNEIGEEVFSVDVDSVNKTFTVKGIKNTTYDFTTHPNPEMNGEKNLHYYLYIRGKNDIKYRKKIRIMVGGVLEGMEIYEVKAGQETLIDKAIEIKSENDEVNWDFRVRYIPSTYRPNDTIFYISGISENGDYIYNGQKINLPIPSGTTKDGKVVDNLLNDTVSMNDQSDVKDGTIFGSGDFKVLKHSINNNSESGYQDIRIDYTNNNNGKSVRIVALSKESGLYTSVSIKNNHSAGIILRSTTMRASKVLVNKPTENEQIPSTVCTKSMLDATTPYNYSYTQEYPYTITTDNPSERTFYVHVNGILEINIETTFPLSDLTFIRSDDASKYLFGEFSEDNSNTKKRTLTVSTAWSKMSKSDKKEDCTNVEQVNRQYLTNDKGVKTYITFTKDGVQYSIPINFVIYSTSDSKFS